MASRIIVCLLLLLPLYTFSQTAPRKYFVSFSDKANSPFSIQNPIAFLSARAIERRERQQIEIKENDLPVNPQYLDSLRANGAKVLHTSKWFNAATIELSDTTLIDTISLLPFVVSQEQLVQSATPDRHNVTRNSLDRPIDARSVPT